MARTEKVGGILRDVTVTVSPGELAFVCLRCYITVFVSLIINNTCNFLSENDTFMDRICILTKQ